MSNFKKVRQAAFAEILGCSKSYVTALKKAGRLVMSDDGKMVLVNPSLVRIKETEDPNRDDVRKRKAVDTTETAPSDGDGGATEGTPAYQASRAKNEYYKSKMQEAEYLKQIGKLVDAEVVQKVGIEMGTHLRTSLENMQDQLAAELAAETDATVIYATLGEHFERVLKEIGRNLGNMIEDGGEPIT